MWKLRSLRLWGRQRPALGSEPGNGGVPSELADLVRSAFPRPAASEGLHRRVTDAWRSASTATGSASAGPAPWAERVPARFRVALAFTLAALVLLPMLTLRKPVGIASAEAAPTAGALEVVDALGRAVGLCPLKHTDVKADVAGYVARVTVKQEFENPSDGPVEALYTFPLPSDAAVDAMTMTLGDRVIRGEVKRRDEARRIYDAAREAGEAAALLDQERPNIFTQSVANIMPRQKVTITISYVNLLKYDDGKYELVYPMVVGPRYTGGSSGYGAPGLRGAPSPAKEIVQDPGTEAVTTDADRITPPIAPAEMRAGHDISVAVQLDAGVALGDVTSVQQAVDVERETPSRATVRLKDRAVLPNKDFILRFTTAGEEIRAGVLAHATGDGGGYFTLILQPPSAPPQEEVC